MKYIAKDKIVSVEITNERDNFDFKQEGEYYRFNKGSHLMPISQLHPSVKINEEGFAFYKASIKIKDINNATHTIYFESDEERHKFFNTNFYEQSKYVEFKSKI